jgi:DNA-binding LacI/PurR family transcriptional regulator
LVGIDDEAAARDAAQHLVDLGHRQLAVVSFGLGPDFRNGLADDERQRSAAYHVSRARLAGYKAALTGHGVSWSNVPVFECPGSSSELGRGAADALLAGRPRPTAILATSDELALGVMEAAARRGLSVPADLSVVGFDDVPAAAASTPSLTTVHQDHEAKGRLAGQMLVALVRREPLTSPQHVATRLVIRQSTAAPAYGGR